MKIETGLFPHCVLQRNDQDLCDVIITGTCNRDGSVVVTVSQEDAPLNDFVGEAIGSAEDGRFTARLQGLPVGGPYQIQLSLTSATGKWVDSVTVPDVLVGDLWLLGGQSNMQGVGLLSEAPEPDARVRALFLDGEWKVAKESLHNMHESADDVHRVLAGGTLPAPMIHTGTGPGHAFGLEMLRQRQVPQGLIAAAHGGTTMTQWDPARRDEGENSLYGAMIQRLRRNGGRVCGMVWYQGESDSNADAAAAYTQRMIDLVEALRRDAEAPELPVAIVQIARVIGWGEETAVYWNSVQDQQRRLPKRIAQVATVPAIDLSLDDMIHISGRGQCILGRRLAEAMQALLGEGELPPPIELESVEVHPSERDFAEIHLRFRNVVGELRAGGRPYGFHLLGGNFFDIKLSGDTAIIRTNMSTFQAQGVQVHYGWHTNPYCNIVDGAGRSLPVFGPLHVGEPRAMSPAVRRLLCSPIQPSSGDLAQLACPAWDALDLSPREFTADFCNRQAELAASEDGVAYYAVRLIADEPSSISLLYGYDGPTKVWLDGTEIFHDPAGTNPATPAKATIDVELDGEHRLLMALGANQGRAWGIFLRLLRKDVTREAAESGDYTMPRVEL